MSMPASQVQPFVDRRAPNSSSVAPGKERRQFSSTYSELSPEARELALKVDEYKLLHHRRFVTYEELLGVIRTLGYHK